MTFKEKATSWLQTMLNKLNNLPITTPIYKDKFLWRLSIVMVLVAWLVMALSGCTTQVQLVRAQPPAALMEPAPELTKLPSSPLLQKTTQNTTK